MRTSRTFFLLLSVLIAGSASAQHEHSPYATQEHSARSIAALSEAEIASLQNGDGMGFALAAELNGYPGPKHVLELAGDLALTEGQVAAVTALFEEMKASAIALGEELLGIERHLDASFSSADITPQALTRMTGHAASIRGNLRAAHLGAHLEMMTILTPEQIEQYSTLRGYASP